MRISAKNRTASLAKTELVCVFGFSSGAPELPGSVELTPGARKDFKGDFRQLRLADCARGPAKRVLLIGLGPRAEVDAEKVRRAAALAAKQAAAQGCSAADVWVASQVEDACGGALDCGACLAEGALMGSYEYLPHKSQPKKPTLRTLALWGSGAAFRKGVRAGNLIGQANCFARDLQNAPGNCMRPRDLAAAARKLAQASPRVRVKVLDERAMKQLGMGALLGVSRGSVEPAQLIHLTYSPKSTAKKRPRVALVGKGLTFDAGGISLKPALKMWDMKYDMSGGAAVLGVFHALAHGLDVNVEVHGVVPASENLPDAAATKPGDLSTAMNGTTIEVLNTDAEGRLILADALCYTVSKIKPDTIIDLATLTGAVVIALGHELSGMFASTTKLRDALTAAGEEVGEPVWPLPLFDFHKEQMKGEVADLRNINSPNHGNGSTAGAAFLSHFVGDVEWAHLDIAGTAWGARERDWVGGNQGTGVGVRLLMRYLQMLPGIKKHKKDVK